MTRWHIWEYKPGTFEVAKGRRRLGEHTSLEDALARVRQEFDPHEDTLHHIAPDGYRTNLIHEVGGQRRSWGSGWRRN